VLKANDVFDAFSISICKPLLIGEFHFGAAERGAAYQYCVERTAALPAMVGAHYYLGLLTQLDLPYPELVSFAKAAHRRMYRLHAGALAPTDRTAK